MEPAALCDRHGYPAPLADALEELSEAASACLPGLRAVIVSGSLATGDFLWRPRGDAGGVELLSDVDAFAFAPLGVADVPELRRRLRKIEARTGSVHFKIDLSVSPPSALARIPATYQMAETRRAGYVLAGEDLRAAFPDHFDPRASRQSFLANLWKPIAAWCDREADGGLAFSLAASRLLVDVALLAASEDGLCLPGHRARCERFLAGGPPESLASDESLRWAVEAGWAARLEPPGQAGNLEPLLAPTVARTVALLDGGGPPPADPGAGLVRRLASWLPPRTMRRRLGELRTVLRRPSRPDRDLRWLLDRKEAVAGACLLGWLVWLGSEGEGPPPAGVGHLLATLARRPSTPGLDAGFHGKAAQLYREAWREYSPSAANTIDDRRDE